MLLARTGDEAKDQAQVVVDRERGAWVSPRVSSRGQGHARVSPDPWREGAWEHT